jgi:glutathione reductase (NADPH)
MMDEFDALVVGSGTGGQTAAFALNEAGLRVAVVDKSDRPGGTCALVGCQPKKWFYEAAETIARSRHLLGKGISTAASAQWSEIRRQKNVFTAEIPEKTLKAFKDAGIAFLPGRAKFLSGDLMQVDGDPIKARYYILATGAKPAKLPITGRENLITSDEFLELKDLPRSIIFVGGGFISFEFAHFAARLGPDGIQVKILEASERPLAQFDQEMIAILLEASKQDGIEVFTKAEIASIEKRTGGWVVLTRTGESLYADLIVHGAGRSPYLEDLALGAGGIDYSPRGIAVDEGMRTSNPNVFAIGDCAATLQLARVADFEGHVAARNILAELKNTAPAKINYEAVPAMLFTYPQYGMVGQTEEALARQNISFRKSFAKDLQWPSYRRVGMKHAAYKILAGKDNRILGAHILSDNASGLINTLKQAMIDGVTANSLYWQNIMSPYPTRESDLIYMLKHFL